MKSMFCRYENDTFLLPGRRNAPFILSSPKRDAGESRSLQDAASEEYYYTRHLSDYIRRQTYICRTCNMHKRGWHPTKNCIQ